MITTHTRVLLIEDNPDDARLIQLMLRKTGLAQFQVTVTDRLAAGHDYLAQHAVDVILLDMSLPDGRGLEALKRTLASAPGAPVVVLTGLDDYDTGRAAISLGAQDYLIKDRIDGDLLARAISYAVERKHATDQLRLQAAILAQVQDAVITTDLNFVIQTWNHAAETIYGWHTDEVIGKPISILLQTFFPGSPREVIVEELMAQGMWQGEVVHRRKDNGLVFAWVSATLIRDSTGQPVGIASVNRDVTGRMQAEQALRESEHKFRSVVEQSVDGIVLIDEDGTVIEWNRAMEQITGLARTDALSCPIWDVQYRFVPDEHKSPAAYQAIKERVLPLLQTGQTSWPAATPPREIQRPDGEYRIIQTAVYPIQTDQGFMASSIMRDITDQTRAQQALEESHVFLQHTLDALAAHIAILDETGTIIAVNEAWRQFAIDNNLPDPAFGLGTNYLAVCESASGEGAQEVAEGIRKALAGRKNGFYLEYPCHSPDEQRWFMIQLHRFQVNENVRVVVAHYNITERKRAEEALAAERTLLRTLVDHMPDFIYAKDREGRYIFKNLSDIRHMGASSPEEVVGQTDFDYYPEELATLYQADDQMVTRFGQSLINREEPSIGADGQLRWLLTTKVPLRSSADEIVGLVGVGRDVTERKRTQQQLEGLHAELNLLYRISKQLGQTLDLDTVYETLHEAITSRMDCDGLYISSYTPHDQVTRCVWAWGDGKRLDASQFPPIPLAEEGKGIQSEVIRTGEALHLPDYRAWLEETLDIVHESAQFAPKAHEPSEENLPRSALFVPLKLENQVLGVIQVFSYRLGAYIDDDLRFLKALAPQAAAATANARLYRQTQHEVAERTRAETALRELNEKLEQLIAERTAELRESEARYRGIVEDQTDLICRHLPDTTLTFVNDAYCRFHGLSREALIGRSFKPLISQNDLPQWEEAYARLSPANPLMTLEHRSSASDGKIHWTQWSNRLFLDENGLPIEVQGVGRDITRQKQAEEMLRQALTHEIQLNEMRSRFISMASHDLRTPLAVIQASTDLLSQYSHRLSEERKAEGFQQIQLSIRHMVDLLDDILIIGRVEAGKLEFEPEPVDLKALCHNLLTELRTSIDTDHRLEFSASGESGNIWVDPKLLRHMLNNLVSNAIKYSPPGSPVKVDLKQGHDQVILSVEDQGIGIPVDDQKNLFQTFFRASNVGSVPGTGLGLAIVQQSVELHGGSITFESRLKEGTTFFVFLPCISLEERA